MRDSSPAVSVDAVVCFGFECILHSVCTNGRYQIWSVHPGLALIQERTLTDATDRGAEMSQNGGLGIAHLALHRELRLHEDIAHNSTRQGNKHSGEQEDRGKEDYGEHLQHKEGHHLGKQFGRSREAIVHYNVLNCQALT